MMVRHKATRLLFLAAAVVLGLVMAAGDFQGSPVHAQPVASPGVTISETSLEIEEGNTALYTVVLDTAPAGYVGVSIGGFRAADLTLNRAQLFFTVQNWNVPQTVAVTANHDNDGIDEAAVTLTHTVSSPDDGDYDGLSAAGVTVTVTDDDYAEVLIEDDSLEMEEGGSNFTAVWLATMPAGTVTLTIGGATGTDLTPDPASLTFTPQNWRRGQRVTFTVEHDDDLADDPQVIITFTASSLDDGDYDGLEPLTLPINTSDDDRPGVTVTPNNLRSDEGGSAKTYTVVLDTQPTAEVTVRAYTPEPNSFERFLAFTTQNWNIPQEVQVDFAPVDNNTFNSNYDIYHSANYRPVVSVTSRDRDVPASFSLGEVQPVAEDAGTMRVEVVGVTTGEGAPTTDFALRLQAYELESLGFRPATAGSDFVGVDEQIDFPRDGFTEFINDRGQTRYRQTVTFDVEILNDGIAEDTETFGLELSPSEEFRFLGAFIPHFGFLRDVKITDDDTAGVTISETSLEIDEGASDTYEVALDTEPEGNVTVTIEDATGTDLTPDPASLTFTKQNWIAPQTVTVTAGQDHDVLDDEAILTHTVSSSRDGIYDGLSAADVTVSVTDNDRPPVTVSFESATYSPTEGDSFEVKVILSGDPERTVVVPLTRTEQGGASVDDYSGVPANVTFNAGETEKSFTFTAIPDEVDDDGKSVELGFGSPPADGVSAGYIVEAIVSIDGRRRAFAGDRQFRGQHLLRLGARRRAGCAHPGR